ncbi:MAG: hypothetical protein Q9225_007755 [Loekoesia sp. 1 TL-2023]
MAVLLSSQSLCIILTLLSTVTLSCESFPPPPKALNVHIHNTANYDPAPLSNLYNTLTTDHTIRSISLKFSEGGCVVGFNPFAFPFQPGDRFPPLTTLRLDGYDFDDANGAILEKNKLAVSGIRGWRNYLANEYGYEWLLPEPLKLNINKGSNLRMWRNAMDWSHIERLELKHVDLLPFFEQMSGELSNLKDLALWPAWWRTVGDEETLVEATENFLMSVPPLERLFLHGYTGRVDSLRKILRRHGPGLETLKLREWESDNVFNPRPVLSPAQLVEVRDLCPKLKHLSIDVDRNGTWPTEVFNILSAFESLQHLELNLELGIDHHIGEIHDYLPPDQRNLSVDDFRQPSFNAEAGSWLFRMLRERKQGSELQKLAVTIGDWGRDFGRFYRFPGWGEGLEEKWKCQVLDGNQQGELPCVKVGDGCIDCVTGWEDG